MKKESSTALLWEAMAKLSQSLQPCENPASPRMLCREHCHCIFLYLAAHFSYNSDEVLQYEQLEPAVLTCAPRFSVLGKTGLC